MIYLFNPWHDLALANFTTSYTPPASAVKMSNDLALLPAWYGGDDAVIAEGETNRSFLDTVKHQLPITAEIISIQEIASCRGKKIIPWGWNPMLRRKMVVLGADELQLPSIEELELLKAYANRKNAVRLLQELKEEEENFCGESHYFSRLEELLEFLQSIPGDKILKMPVSGSGKGLIWILGNITDKQTDWCRRVIREQGGVVAEPVLRKVQDFAMEFYLQKGTVQFSCYSLFRSAASGTYAGNELLSDERIEEKLSGYISMVTLRQLRDSLSAKLSQYFPKYSGYAGVDMMVCETDEGYRIQPCVEINMRMNMGVVARIFHDRYMNHSAEGKFVVDFFKKPGSAKLFHEKMQREWPLEVVQEKIISGYLPLTPVTSDTCYMAYVQIC
ncbi:MAG: hypothetical protein LLF80_05905 [Porphyromonadaceae bacterium]|nr:hypothetical protein [Porphyromonadaceae bacterium]